MAGSHQTWHCKIDANGVLKKDGDGKFYGEYAWSGMISDGAPHSHREASQKLSLEPDVSLSVPDLSHVGPKITGRQHGNVFQGGRSFLFQEGTPNSWADGNYVFLRQDPIDVDLTLTKS
jgi:hypothetical protein